MNTPHKIDHTAADTTAGPGGGVGANPRTELDAEAQTALDQAATSLLGVGCADPFGTDPEVRLHCLWAVERLRTVGAHPDRTLTPLPAAAVHAALQDAVAALALLAPDLLRGLAVDDAVVVALSHLDSDR